MANPGARTERDNVVPISKAKEIRERKAPFRNTTPSVAGDIRSDDAPAPSGKDNGPKQAKEQLVSGSTCAYILNGVVPLPENLEKLLEIPSEMFMSSDMSSFTSESGRHVAAAAYALAYGEPLPKELPEYGICTFRKGSSLFCLLVDKKRRIMAFSPISSLYGPSGGWETFQDSLAEGIGYAKRLQQSGEEFAFVLMEGLISRRIDPESPAGY